MNRPRQYPDEPRIHVGIRMPQELHGRLRDQAYERDVSVNWIIIRAVTTYLDSLQNAPDAH